MKTHTVLSPVYGSLYADDQNNEETIYIQGGAGTARHAGHVLCGTARHVLNGHVLIRHGTARFEWARFGSARAGTL